MVGLALNFPEMLEPLASIQDVGDSFEVLEDAFEELDSATGAHGDLQPITLVSSVVQELDRIAFTLTSRARS